MACGLFSHAQKDNSIAIGNNNIASGNNLETNVNNESFFLGSQAFGQQNIASGEASSAFGLVNQASGYSSIAFGSFNKASGWTSNALGYKNIASGSQSTSIGFYNQSLAERSSTLGFENIASGLTTAAMGNINTASMIFSSALGNNNNASNFGSLALGNGYQAIRRDKINANTIIIDGVIELVTSIDNINLNLSNVFPDNIVSINGNTSLTNTEKKIFLDYFKNSGMKNNASGMVSSSVGIMNQSSGAGSTTIGFYNKSLAENSHVLGSYSQAIANNSTAIGYNSLADEENTISVGRLGAEKRITNIAAAVKDTDAVNYSQLKNAGINLTNALGGGANFTTNQFNTPTYIIQDSNYNNVGNAFTAVDSKLTNLQTQINSLPSNGAAGKSAYLIAKDEGFNGTQIEWLASLRGETGKNAFDLAVENGYTGTEKEWISALSQQKNLYFQIQSNTTETELPAQALGKNAIAIGTNTNAHGEQSISIGSKNKVTGNYSGSIGDLNLVSGHSNYAIGNNNIIIGNDTIVLGHDVSTTANNAVILGNGSSSERDNTVSIGSPTQERQIIHVAAGIAESDAVNLRQMKDTNAKSLQDAKTYAEQGDQYMLKQAKEYTNQRLTSLNHNFSEFKQDSQAALASALAIASLPQPTQAGYSMMSMGVGTWEGQQGYALGLSGITENNKFIFKAAGTANTQGSVGGGMAIGWQWK
ncbi:hypothetical protein A7P55_13470 [Acinetobacter sp. Ac_5812]|nr:hypothetical protein [Acinetobacter sp. Ac_5812]